MADDWVWSSGTLCLFVFFVSILHVVVWYSLCVSVTSRHPIRLQILDLDLDDEAPVAPITDDSEVGLQTPTSAAAAALSPGLRRGNTSTGLGPAVAGRLPLAMDDGEAAVTNTPAVRSASSLSFDGDKENMSLLTPNAGD